MPHNTNPTLFLRSQESLAYLERVKVLMYERLTPDTCFTQESASHWRTELEQADVNANPALSDNSCERREQIRGTACLLSTDDVVTSPLPPITWDIRSTQARLEQMMQTTPRLRYKTTQACIRAHQETQIGKQPQKLKSRSADHLLPNKRDAYRNMPEPKPENCFRALNCCIVQLRVRPHAARACAKPSQCATDNK